MAHVMVLEQLATFLTLRLANPDSSEPVPAVQSEASISRSRAGRNDKLHSCTLQRSFTVESTLKKNLIPSDGPSFKTFEGAKCKVSGLPGGGGGVTFVENHVHKLLQI